MSAFVVSDGTINAVLSYLKMARDKQWEISQLAKGAEIEESDPDFWQKLGVSMHILNVVAVNERYAEDSEPDLNYTFKLNINAHRFQALKSLRCWLYQCSEGDVPETSTLYQAADAVSGSLALSIVQDLPQYENATWG